MSREVVYRCDGPDCGVWIQTAAEVPARGWLTVREREDGNVIELDFCGWACLLRKAAGVDPEETIPADL